MILHFRIKQNCDTVFEHLSDMDKFVSVHPVISRIEAKGNDCYRAHETLKFVYVPFSFTYPVTIEKNNETKSVIMRATVFRLIKMQLTFTLSADHEYTNVEEKIQFDTILPVKPLLKKVFRKQHHILFKNIESRQN